MMHAEESGFAILRPCLIEVAEAGNAGRQTLPYSAAQLSQIRLLAQLSKNEMNLLLGAALCRRVQRGDEIRPAGSRPALLLILSGTFRIEMISQSGQIIGMRSAKPGDALGGYALAAGVPPYHMCIVAQADGEFLEIPEHHVKRCLNEIPAFCQAMLIGASETIISFADHIVELTTLGLRDRLLLELLRLSQTALDIDVAIRLDPAPSHETLASVLGVTREAVTRELGQLSRAGNLSVKRGLIVIPDRARLRDCLSHPLALRLSDHFEPLFTARDQT